MVFRETVYMHWAMTEHPNSTTSYQAKRLFEKQPAMAKPFLLSVRTAAADLRMSFAEVAKTSFAGFVPPWEFVPCLSICLLWRSTRKQLQGN